MMKIFLIIVLSLYIRFVTRIIVFNSKLAATGYRLKRGYKTRTNMEDKPRDIDHLVFVVHGIGQKRDTGKIIRNTTWYVKIISILMRCTIEYFYKIVLIVF